LIRGAIISFSVILSSFLIAVFSEYYGHFSETVRAVIFFGFLAVFTINFINFIFVPILKLFQIGKTLSHKTAAIIISKYFPEIQDKLTNILELKEMFDENQNDKTLILAAVDQKIANLKAFNFANAVDLKNNKKYLKYAVPALFVFLLILIVSPGIFPESAGRIVNYSKVYEKPAPFNFILQNDTLNCKKGTDFTLKMKIYGEYVPEEIFIEQNGKSFLMSRSGNSKTEFTYVFKNILQTTDFSFQAETYNSKQFTLNVMPSPVILNFALHAEVPKYTKQKNIDVSNTGDLTVPCGTKITWNFATSDAEVLKIKTENKYEFPQKSENKFTLTKILKQSMPYSITVSNKYFETPNYVNYNINVIPDLYPEILVNEIKDSANFFVAYFNGQINDDYGFKKLNFNYRVVSKQNPDENTKYEKTNINLNFDALKQEFYYTFNFSEINKNPENTIEYYFEIFDNDEVNGSKSTKTSVNSFKILDFQEIKKLENDVQQNIQSKISQSVKLANELKNDINNLNQKNLDGNSTEWEKTQMLKNISEKQEMLQDLLKETAKENQQKNELQNNFNEQQKDLLEKQKQIEDLLNKTMDEDLKKLLDQIKELQQKYDQQKQEKLSKDMKMNYDDLSKQLERNLEMLKRYDVEKSVDQTIDNLKKLSDKEKKLAEKNENSKNENQQIKDEQKQVKDEFENLKKDWNDVLEKNKELKNPMKLDDFKKQSDEISEDLKKTEDQMNKSKSQKSSESQKSNSQKMQKMAKDMQSMMESQQSESNSEDIENLKQIEKNLITFSYSQEKVMTNISKLTVNNAEYDKNTKKQISLKDDFTIIRDSLNSLAVRVPAINYMIQKELGTVNNNLNTTIDLLHDSKKRDAGNNQQLIMTSANNLALMISEIISQMQNQQGSGIGGKSDNKRGKKPSLGEMEKGQQSLKKQLENMLQQLKDGQGKQDQNSQNKQLAKMLAQQEIFQQMLQDLQNGNDLSPEAAKILNEIKQMNEQNQNDLINKNITPELIQRQQKITNRLLEAENAQNQRETEEKRQSKEADDKKFNSAKDYFKKSDKKSGFDENLNKSNLNMNHFYKSLYDNYRQNLEK
jgi:hypothetical protein